MAAALYPVRTGTIMRGLGGRACPRTRTGVKTAAFSLIDFNRSTSRRLSAAPNAARMLCANCTLRWGLFSRGRGSTPPITGPLPVKRPAARRTRPPAQRRRAPLHLRRPSRRVPRTTRAGRRPARCLSGSTYIWNPPVARTTFRSKFETYSLSFSRRVFHSSVDSAPRMLFRFSVIPPVRI